jgi:hypothetical protein
MGLQTLHGKKNELVTKCSKSLEPGWILWIRNLNNKILILDLDHGMQGFSIM